MLSKEERNNICQAVCDFESGNHLRFPRSADAHAMRNELCRIKCMKTTDLSERDIEILQYSVACEDPESAKSYLRQHPEYADDFPADCRPSTT
jgi:hypothetical protein